MDQPSRNRVARRVDRRADLAAIHIGAKALGWSDDEYRDIMATVCGGIRSAGALDAAGRRRFLAHLQACQRTMPKPVAPKRQPLTATQALMWSLWMQLVDAGLAHGRSMAALNAFVHRQTKVDRVEWLNGAQEELVIESLKQWLSRAAG